MSQNYLESCIPLPIEEKQLIDVITKAKDWAILHGLGMRSKTNYCPDNLFLNPFNLLPTPVPRKEFHQVIQAQTIVNELIHQVAHDMEFLHTTLAETVKSDEFTAKLFQLFEEVVEQGAVQPISLGIIRSDVMLETNGFVNGIETKLNREFCWKQVEINTIAAGSAFKSTVTRELHRYILLELDYKEKIQNMPESDSLPRLSGALVEAWDVFGNPKGVILFVTEDIPYNIADQRFHEYEIREKHPHIKVIRKTLTEIFNEGTNDTNKDLIIGGHIVSVAYFRSGYSPEQYHSQKEWDARRLIEFSTAIKCPSINYHLAGTKKVQQALAAPGVLERFLNDEEKIRQIREMFTGLYPLNDNEAGAMAYKMAMENPERFVLKPQREGGGNNVYGKDIPLILKDMSANERSAWILMERIHPVVFRGYTIRLGSSPTPPPVEDLVSELGIFGVIIGDSTTIMKNYQAGHIVRTKPSTANEGGIGVGIGVVDSPYLFD